MSDSKYASLPGIDRSQPDVYETSDLPEDDQQLANRPPEELSSDSVEKLDVTANQAFQQFKGKAVEITNTDFSDQIGGLRKTGYHIPRSEYEILGETSGIRETPEQRFQRLQHEIRELAEDVNLIKESSKAEGSETAAALSAIALTRQVEYLQHQMADLNLDLGAADVNLSDPQGALQKRLLMELDGFKGSGQKSTAGDRSKPVDVTADSDHVTYQLFYRPEQAKFSNNARVAELEQRLERLESLLGNNQEKITALNSDLATKSLLTAVSTLAARTKLLEPGQLDLVDSRLVAVQQHLNQVAEKKESIEQNGNLTKVNELYDLVKKWDPVVNSVPTVVDRLSGLQQLHEQALNFTQALTHLESTQGQITSLLKSHTGLMQQVQSMMSENIGAVQKNCESLGSRLQALNK